MSIKLSKKRPQGQYSESWYKKGEYKGYTLTVNYSDRYQCYFFRTVKNSDSYDSNWDGKTYTTEADCLKGCEEYIDEVSG